MSEHKKFVIRNALNCEGSFDKSTTSVIVHPSMCNQGYGNHCDLCCESRHSACRANTVYYVLQYSAATNSRRGPNLSLRNETFNQRFR